MFWCYAANSATYDDNVKIFSPWRFVPYSLQIYLEDLIQRLGGEVDGWSFTDSAMTGSLQH